MNPKVALLFVPGWTFTTGSPHLAMPLLQAFLEKAGLDVITRDLNHEIAAHLNIDLSEAAAVSACDSTTLEHLNAPYFQAEDRLMEVAAKFKGKWNAQLGFWYEGSPEKSSRESLSILENPSPFSELYKRDVVPNLLNQQPDVVGLCLASVYQIVPALQLCHLLRSEGYSGFIVLGGNTISRLVKEMSLPHVFDLVDGLIKFQGEIPLLRLCQALQSGTSLESVPNLIWRDDQGCIKENNHSEILDPDSVPHPNYDNLPVGQYWGRNYLNIVAARGCYYGKCSFCAIPYGWGNKGFAGCRSAERVYRDMLTLMSLHGINRFKFVDEALIPSFMKSLAEMCIADGVNIEWEGYVRFEAAWYDPSFVNLVSKAGFRKGYFGLEVVPSKRRNALNKKDRPKPESLLNLCNDNGVKAHLFCMFGYPGTGEEEAKETVEFLLKHQNSIDTADIFPWTYTKHTIVPGVDPIVSPKQDWALEFAHSANRDDVLSYEAIKELASYYEEIIWSEVPRFLHPTYRLVSPWYCDGFISSLAAV